MGKRREKGEGGISWDKQRKRWLVRLNVTLLSGTKKRIHVGYTKTKTEAIKLLNEARSRDFSTPAKMTLKAYLEGWLERSARPAMAASTHERYESAFRNHVVPSLGDVSLSELGPYHIQYFQSHLEKKGQKPSSIRQVRIYLSTAMNEAVRWGLMARNPVPDVRPPKMNESRSMALTKEECQRLVTVVAGTRDEAVYQLAIKTGPRQSEICGLKWEDWDREAGTLKIARTAKVNKGKVVWGPTKTGKVREFYLPPSVAESLHRHHKLQLKERLAAPSWEDPDLMFPNEGGGVWGKTLYHRFKRHLKEAELPDVRFHDLRATCATHLRADGLPIQELADMLGMDPVTLLRTYAHTQDSQKRELARSIDTSYGF